jgi:hypothetical protein
MVAALGRRGVERGKRRQWRTCFGVRKERVRAGATPVAAAYAALLASLSGFGGARLLESRWLDVLDRPVEERLVLLRQAEGLGLARVRSAGDVLEIEVRRPIGDAVGVPDLVNS